MHTIVGSLVYAIKRWMLKEDQKTQQVYLGSGLQQTHLFARRSSLASKQATKLQKAGKQEEKVLESFDFCLVDLPSAFWILDP
jgi:hypothetical protein